MINYYLLMKPGIIMGNLITVAAGFLLASKGKPDFSLFALTLLGLGLVIASGCVFNNLFDASLDKKMERTKHRPSALGLVSTAKAALFGAVLGICGLLILFYFTNGLTALIAASGFFIYVLVYTLWKSKTIYGTAIGSVAGAVPPVVGYCAVKNELDAGGLLLFFMLVLWQMPHFFAIALYRIEDYRAAGLPLYPIVKGVEQAKKRMLLYIIALIAVPSLLTFLSYTGFFFLFVSTAVGCAWLALCLKGFKTEDDQAWSRQMFYFSLVVITLLSFSVSVDAR